jgi:UDP-glucose 6-dehydrogenase
MDSLVAPLLASHAPAGSYGLAYRPSFARERCALGDEQAPHAVIFGYDGGVATRAALEPSVATLGVPARWVGFREAEMAKYGANLFNALKISYFNALGAWAGEGADGRVVAELAAAASEANWNPGYGFRSVGKPFGGLCLPKDLEAFITHLAETGSPHSSLLEAVREVNESLGGPAAAPAP